LLQSDLSLSSPRRILIVDDEADLRDILVEELEDIGYETTTADNGISALSEMVAHDGNFSAILLDRNMPEMDGFQFLDEMRQNKDYDGIPVIFQTAATSTEDVVTGLKKGAYYYITKPYDFAVLFAIVRSAIEDKERLDAMRLEVRDHLKAMVLVSTGTFEFSTLEEAQSLAVMLALACPDPDIVGFGLHELFINAVEHGNCGITFDEKTELVIAGKWEDEVNRRRKLPENNGRTAIVNFSRNKEQVSFHIKDQGQGFAWTDFMEFEPKRAMEPNGRGIALAKAVSFSGLEFLGNGNEVIATVKL